MALSNVRNRQFHEHGFDCFINDEAGRALLDVL
jgi:hypothetical protein